MTLPRLESLNKRWQKVPPLSVTVAAIASALGFKPAAAESKKASAQELFEMLGASGFSMEKPEWLKKTTST